MCASHYELIKIKFETIIIFDRFYFANKDKSSERGRIAAGESRENLLRAEANRRYVCTIANTISHSLHPPPHSTPDRFTQQRASRTPYYISLTFPLWFEPLSYARVSR